MAEDTKAEAEGQRGPLPRLKMPRTVGAAGGEAHPSDEEELRDDGAAAEPAAAEPQRTPGEGPASDRKPRAAVRKLPPLSQRGAAETSAASGGAAVAEAPHPLPSTTRTKGKKGKGRASARGKRPTPRAAGAPSEETEPLAPVPAPATTESARPKRPTLKAVDTAAAAAVAEEESETLAPGQITSSRPRKDRHGKTSARGAGKVSFATTATAADESRAPAEPVRHSAVVEDPTTGKFRHAPASQQQGEKKKPQPQQSKAERPTKPPTEEEVYEAWVCRVESVLLGGAHYGMGLLAGCALMALIVAYTPTSTEGFLRTYSPIAVACQRAMFVLSSVALLGSFVRISRDKRRLWRVEASNRSSGMALPASDLLACLCFALALVMTLVSMPIDDILLYSERRIPTWYDNAQLLAASNEAGFAATLRTWHGCNVFRGIVCILGWAFACAAEAIATATFAAGAQATPRVTPLDNAL